MKWGVVMSTRRRTGVQEARRQLPALLEAAHRGNRTVVTKHGQPYAAIVPVDEGMRERPGLSLLGLRGTGKRIWKRDAGEVVKALRKDWD